MGKPLGGEQRPRAPATRRAYFFFKTPSMATITSSGLKGFFRHFCMPQIFSRMIPFRLFRSILSSSSQTSFMELILLFKTYLQART